MTTSALLQNIAAYCCNGTYKMHVKIMSLILENLSLIYTISCLILNHRTKQSFNKISDESCLAQNAHDQFALGAFCTRRIDIDSITLLLFG